MIVVLSAALAGCDVTLARGLRAEEAEALSSELNQHGVAVTRSEDELPARYRVDVAAGSVETALAALAAPGPWRSAVETPPPSGPLVPSRQSELQRLAREQAFELARSLELLPGVRRARVHLSLPLPSSSLIDPQAAPDGPTPSAAVLLLLDARSPQLLEKVRALLSGAVPGLSDAGIRIVETLRARPAQSCAELLRIGPVSVTRASAGSLKLWLGGALAADMLLAAALLFVLNRSRR